MTYTLMYLSSLCVLPAITWALTGPDESCHLSSSRSLLQTRTQKGHVEEGAWPFSQDPAQHAEVHGQVHASAKSSKTVVPAKQAEANGQVRTSTKYSSTAGPTKLQKQTPAQPTQHTTVNMQTPTLSDRPLKTKDFAAADPVVPAGKKDLAANSFHPAETRTRVKMQTRTPTDRPIAHQFRNIQPAKTNNFAAGDPVDPADNEDLAADGAYPADNPDSADKLISARAPDTDFSDETRAADSALQAPEEGGQFSEYFNNLEGGRGIHSWLHYFPAYKRHFDQFIGQEVHIVHIGVESGGALSMWKHIFGAQAHIYGVYNEPACKAYKEDQVEIFIGAQEDPAFWEDFKSKVPRVDILVDDGGHDVEQVVATMGNMLPHMSSNGIFVTQGIGQDMWWATADHRFWMFLHLEYLTSPEGQSYPGLSQYVSSLHIYPYMMVAELRDNSGPDAMKRQLASSEYDRPSEARMLTAERGAWSDTEEENKTTSSWEPPSDTMISDLRSAFPWFEDWMESGIFKVDLPVDPLLETVPPNGWIIVRDPAYDFSFDAAWEESSDVFLNKITARFIALHRGRCCNPEPNRLQEQVGSLHIYPHLLIAQMLNEKQLLAAPMHGSDWDPVSTLLSERKEPEDQNEEEQEEREDQDAWEEEEKEELEEPEEREGQEWEEQEEEKEEQEEEKEEQEEQEEPEEQEESEEKNHQEEEEEQEDTDKNDEEWELLSRSGE